MKKTKPNLETIRGIILVCVFIFGGLAGVVALAYDWLKQSDYKEGTPVNAATVLKQIGAFGGVLILINFLPAISIGSLGTAGVETFLSVVVQCVIGVIITQKYLHKYNIYLTSKHFWQSLEVQDFGAAFAALNAKKESEKKQPVSSQGHTSSVLVHQPVNALGSSPIELDQSGDKNRLLLIMAAFLLLLGFLFAQYFSQNPEGLINKIEQVFIDATPTDSVEL